MRRFSARYSFMLIDSPIFKGYQLYHNYFREHDMLGKTQAEAANIKIEGRNKWITEIHNATQNQNRRQPP
jgi:hypothetical protein